MPDRYFADSLLAIETSCDETSVAILKGSEILANVIASQIDLHREWGGVVPEAAARAHVQSVLPILSTALKESGERITQIAAIAVTNRPGLIGALSVGVTTAKALAMALRVPLLGVHHLEGHLWSVLAIEPDLQPPFVTLIVSGGHTELIRVDSDMEWFRLGGTIDDAAGEAFDKVARLLGLGYPGGPAVERAALEGNSTQYTLPRAIPDQPTNFSFSGLKSAVLRLCELHGTGININDAAASAQLAIVEVLIEKAFATCEAEGLTTLCVVGGVSANGYLRKRLHSASRASGVRVIVPPVELSTDNAAMIGLAGSLRLARGERSTFDLDVFPNADLALTYP